MHLISVPFPTGQALGAWQSIAFQNPIQRISQAKHAWGGQNNKYTHVRILDMG